MVKRFAPASQKFEESSVRKSLQSKALRKTDAFILFRKLSWRLMHCNVDIALRD